MILLINNRHNIKIMIINMIIINKINELLIKIEFLLILYFHKNLKIIIIIAILKIIKKIS